MKKIPEGKVTTYGEIARALGRPHSSKAVGYALHSNPDHDNIPCHRVVNRFGEPSAAFAFGGKNMQIEMLKAEGVKFKKRNGRFKRLLLFFRLTKSAFSAYYDIEVENAGRGSF